MNAGNASNVDVLKKQFESIQSFQKPDYDVDDGRNEKNVSKRNIKRTPAFRLNVSKKLADHSQALGVTNNAKQFGNRNLNAKKCIENSQTDKRSCKTESLNQKLHLNPFSKNNTNKYIAGQKTLTQCLKKKLDDNGSILIKSIVPKKNIEHTLKIPLPIGPPPKKPPRTFAHDQQIDSNFKHIMASKKSDAKAMLQKLEKFVTENSHACKTLNDKTNEVDGNSKRSSRKSDLFNLAKSLELLESENKYDNSLTVLHTDEQNYLTTKSCDKKDSEHIYEEPIFLKPNPRLNNNVFDNCQSDKSNLYYMVSPSS